MIRKYLALIPAAADANFSAISESLKFSEYYGDRKIKIR
jgi:hypothetical protein